VGGTSPWEWIKRGEKVWFSPPNTRKGRESGGNGSSRHGPHVKRNVHIEALGENSERPNGPVQGK